MEDKLFAKIKQLIKNGEEIRLRTFGEEEHYTIDKIKIEKLHFMLPPRFYFWAPSRLEIGIENRGEEIFNFVKNEYLKQKKIYKKKMTKYIEQNIASNKDKNKIFETIKSLIQNGQEIDESFGDLYSVGRIRVFGSGSILYVGDSYNNYGHDIDEERTDVYEYLKKKYIEQEEKKQRKQWSAFDDYINS